MNWWRLNDPGPCPICDSPHCACTGDGNPITIELRPATTAARTSHLLRADVVQATLQPSQFTTATYRRGKSLPQ